MASRHLAPQSERATSLIPARRKEGRERENESRGEREREREREQRRERESEHKCRKIKKLCEKELLEREEQSRRAEEQRESRGFGKTHAGCA